MKAALEKEFEQYKNSKNKVDQREFHEQLAMIYSPFTKVQICRYHCYIKKKEAKKQTKKLTKKARPAW